MSTPTMMPTPEGPGSVSGAPHLAPGFTDTFSSHYVQANGIRQHVVIGGDGPPLLLVHGWPETWFAWRRMMPALARDFHVIAVDQRGIGLSDKPATGYDVGMLASDLALLMDALGHRRFAVYGTDTGMPIAYALAADHPDRVVRLIVSEAPLPGVSPSPPLFLPAPRNEKLWHIAFNRAAEVNERLVAGREDVFFGNEFEVSAGRQLRAGVVQYYIDMLRSDEHSLRGSFGWYRELDATIAQNSLRKERPLTMPVLAIGAELSSADTVGAAMRLAADDVQAVVIMGVGHWVAEEAPEELLSVITSFLDTYRKG
jgi:pimeloyl-ACP methyl ester carboxylesterase